MNKVLISVFKSRGKWNYDTFIHIPEDVTTYHLVDFIQSKIKGSGIIVVHTDNQPNSISESLVGFPRMIFLKEE